MSEIVALGLCMYSRSCMELEIQWDDFVLTLNLIPTRTNLQSYKANEQPYHIINKRSANHLATRKHPFTLMYTPETLKNIASC